MWKQNGQTVHAFTAQHINPFLKRSTFVIRQQPLDIFKNEKPWFINFDKLVRIKKQNSPFIGFTFSFSRKTKRLARR